MPQAAATPTIDPQDPSKWSPFLTALFASSDEEPAPPKDATQVPAGQPQQNRTEDDQTAGTRGVTPQSPTTTSKPFIMTPAMTTGNNENPVGSPTQPLQEQIRQEQLEYGRMSQPPAKKSLLQRIGGVSSGAALGTLGPQAVENAATRRDQMIMQQNALKNDLANRIATNSQALSQQQEGLAERIQAAQIAAQEREDYARIMAGSRIGTADIGAQSRENVAQTQAGAHTQGIAEQQAGADTRTQETNANRLQIAQLKDQELRDGLTRGTLTWGQLGGEPVLFNNVTGEVFHTGGLAQNPTGQTRSMGEAASVVSGMTPALLSQIDALAPQLGAFQGRFNQAYVSRMGANDPQFSSLDEGLQLYASGVARAHFGARSTGAASEFKRYLTEAQTADDLKARIQTADQWMNQYSRRAGLGGGPQPQPTQPGGGQPSGFKPF